MVDIIIQSKEFIEQKTDERKKIFNKLLAFMVFSCVAILIGDHYNNIPFMAIGTIALFLSGTGLLAFFKSAANFP